jgi:hypothetical protein
MEEADFGCLALAEHTMVFVDQRCVGKGPDTLPMDQVNHRPSRLSNKDLCSAQHNTGYAAHAVFAADLCVSAQQMSIG